MIPGTHTFVKGQRPKVQIFRIVTCQQTSQRLNTLEEEKAMRKATVSLTSAPGVQGATLSPDQVELAPPHSMPEQYSPGVCGEGRRQILR